MPRVVLETKMEGHHPALYRSDEAAISFEGFASPDEAVLGQYLNSGYVLIRNAFTPEEVGAALRELEAMSRSDDPQCEGVYFEGTIRDVLGSELPEGKENRVAGDLQALALGQTGDTMPALPAERRAKYVRKFNQFTEHHPPLRRMIEKPAMMRLVDLFLGEASMVLQEMAMIKPPKGREKPWHQDHAYFNYPLETRIVGAWIALSETTPGNGCMHLLAGEHLNGPQLHWRRRDWQICDDGILPQRHTVAPMNAGDLLLFDSKLPHGTPTNHSGEGRWALQFHYIGASSVETSDDARLLVFGAEGKDAVC